MRVSQKYLISSLLFCPVWGGVVVTSSPAFAQESAYRYEKPWSGTTVIYDDTSGLPGGQSRTTHQEDPDYWIEKTLFVPAKLLESTKLARLRVSMCVLDYSQGLKPEDPANGLDESLELLVNGQSHVYRTADGFSTPKLPGEAMKWEWREFAIPVSQLKAGNNTFLFRKLPSPGNKNDDFFYIAIDGTVNRGHSRSTIDGGKSWRTDKLNKLDTAGEYMIRLVLSEEEQGNVTVDWTPQGLNDGANLIGYSESKNQRLELELDRSKINRKAPWRTVVEYQGDTPPLLQWFDERGRIIPADKLPVPVVTAGKIEIEWPVSPAISSPARLELPNTTGVSKVEFKYVPTLDAAELDPKNTHTINIAPTISKPVGRLATRSPRSVRNANSLVLENKLLKATFELGSKIKLKSIYHEYLAKNILAHPENAHIFLVEVDGKRFAANDFIVRKVTALPAGKSGVLVDLYLPEHSLQASLRLSIDDTGLRMGLDVKNAGTAAKSWKTAFPQVGGLVLSPKEENDYYLFPHLGGIIADKSIRFRSIYGGYTSWWQMVDLFSPSGGAGVSLRVDDTNGLYKQINFRKGINPAFEQMGSSPDVLPELQWKDSLESAPGSAISFEYVSRTREPGQGFAVPDAVLEPHIGDWHQAMRTYADWAHNVWKWRPLSPKLKDIWSITTPGWGVDSLFRDGKFRTDYFKSAEAAELMSWWEWSKTAPWGVPTENIDEIKAKLSDKWYNEYLVSYMGSDGASAEKKYSFNPGQYAYHQSWGGLPALKKHVDNMRAQGVMSMLYTCPPLVDGNSEFARQYGAKYAIKNKVTNYPYKISLTPEGYVGDFGAWNMCIDNEWYQNHFASTMKRIVNDTGVDGFRMDVFGYPGYACNNEQHKHIYAEPGHNAYLQATTAAIGKIRTAVGPNTVLNAEYPGNDAMARYIDATLVYECSWNLISGIRTVPTNLFRYYFPEVKTYDLDELTPSARAAASYEFTFWHGMGRFGTLQHPLYHRILLENGDAYNTPNPKSLVPTLTPQVYANQFAVAGKSLLSVYNSRRFTLEAPIVEMKLGANERLFELVSGQEIKPVIENGKSVIKMKLRPNQVASIARLTKRISLSKTAQGYQVQVTPDKSKTPLRAVLCSADGVPILEAKVAGNSVLLPNPTDVQLKAATDLAKEGTLNKPVHLPEPTEAKASYIKLMRGKYLVDAVALPTN